MSLLRTAVTNGIFPAVAEVVHDSKRKPAVVGEGGAICTQSQQNADLALGLKYHHSDSLPSSHSEMGEDGVCRTFSSQIANVKMINVKIEFLVKKFDALMDLYAPCEELLSEGVASPLLPLAIWKLSIYPNYPNFEGKQGGECCRFALKLTGPMKDDNQQLIATFRLSAFGRSGSFEIGKDTKNFGKDGNFNWGWEMMKHEIKGKLRSDGSLKLKGEIDYFTSEKK